MPGDTSLVQLQFVLKAFRSNTRQLHAILLAAQRARSRDPALQRGQVQNHQRQATIQKSQPRRVPTRHIKASYEVSELRER